MKEHKALTPRQEALAERSLCAAIASLHSVDECRAFLRDLCTPAELQALADRWAVVGLLQEGIPYREIHKQTGVSVTTIGRVARYLISGNGGYNLVTERMNGQGKDALLKVSSVKDLPRKDANRKEIDRQEQKVG